MSARIGHGVDAHRLAAGIPLRLGCIEIAHGRGLAGHSDGDVAAHALAHAILAGAGLGDMGGHFPSDDERWKGAAGAQLLGEAASRAAAAGLAVSSGQVVLIAQEPHLQPHLAAMAEAMSAAIGGAPGTIAVTATSTDSLGAIGRGEGIAASAVVLLEPRSPSA